MTRPDLLQGDAVTRLKEMPAKSVQSCVTSPPYWGLRDYGVDDQLGLEPTPEEYVANLVAVFREVRRVLRDDGTVWLNLGDSYAGSGKGAWNKTDVQKEVYVPKPGGAEASMPKVPLGLKPKDLVGIPWRVAFALQADGWYLRSDIIWNKSNPMPEPVKDRPTKSHEYIFLLAKNRRYYYDADAIKEASMELGATKIRFGGNKYGVSDDVKHQTKSGNRYTDAGTRNVRSVWTFNTQAYSEAHFATFPEALPERCIKAGTKPGDTVLDPFAGSGTTCAVAARLGRASIGIELNPEYLELAQKRCWHNSRSLYDFNPNSYKPKAAGGK